MTKIYRWSGRLLARCSPGAFFRAVGKELLLLVLYAAWLIAELFIAVYLLVYGFRPGLVIILILAMDIIGRGVFRHGKTDFKSWKDWFWESYVENLRSLGKGILGLLKKIKKLVMRSS